MKKGVKKILICLLFILFVAGCGAKNKNSKSVSSDGLISFNDDTILSKYETKQLDTDVTYKELYYKNKNDLLRLYIIVYNNRDNAIRVNGFVKGYNGNVATSQVTQSASEIILAHSTYVLGFSLIDADNYKIEHLLIDNDNYPTAIASSDYVFESYKISNDTQFFDNAYREIPTLNIYLKYNGTRTNNSKIRVLGFKNDEFICSDTKSLLYVDSNHEPNYDKDVSNKGDIGSMGSFCQDGYLEGIKVNDITKFIYFVSGHYKN